MTSSLVGWYDTFKSYLPVKVMTFTVADTLLADILFWLLWSYSTVCALFTHRICHVMLRLPCNLIL